MSSAPRRSARLRARRQQQCDDTFVNPDTGRCIRADGRVAAALRIPPEQRQPCASVANAATGRCVARTLQNLPPNVLRQVAERLPLQNAVALSATSRQVRNATGPNTARAVFREIYDAVRQRLGLMVGQAPPQAEAIAPHQSFEAGGTTWRVWISLYGGEMIHLSCYTDRLVHGRRYGSFVQLPLKLFIDRQNVTWGVIYNDRTLRPYTGVWWQAREARQAWCALSANTRRAVTAAFNSFSVRKWYYLGDDAPLPDASAYTC